MISGNAILPDDFFPFEVGIRSLLWERLGTSELVQ
jgi:hypothetical protein